MKKHAVAAVDFYYEFLKIHTIFILLKLYFK